MHQDFRVDVCPQAREVCRGGINFTLRPDTFECFSETLSATTPAVLWICGTCKSPMKTPEVSTHSPPTPRSREPGLLVPLAGWLAKMIGQLLQTQKLSQAPKPPGRETFSLSRFCLWRKKSPVEVEINVGVYGLCDRGIFELFEVLSCCRREDKPVETDSHRHVKRRWVCSRKPSQRRRCDVKRCGVVGLFGRTVIILAYLLLRS